MPSDCFFFFVYYLRDDGDICYENITEEFDCEDEERDNIINKTKIKLLKEYYDDQFKDNNEEELLELFDEFFEYKLILY